MKDVLIGAFLGGLAAFVILVARAMVQAVVSGVTGRRFENPRLRAQARAEAAEAARMEEAYADAVYRANAMANLAADMEQVVRNRSEETRLGAGTEADDSQQDHKDQRQPAA